MWPHNKARVSSQLCFFFSEVFFAVHPRTLRYNPSAWRIVWDWAAGVFEFPELINKLQTAFGDSFVQADWTPTFNAVFDTSAPDSDDEQNEAALADNSGVTPPTSSAVQVVEDTMEALGVSIRASRTLVLPSCNPKAPSHHSPSPRSRPPTKRRKTVMASIFLDLSADEEDKDKDKDKEDEEDVARLQYCPTSSTRWTRTFFRPRSTPNSSL